MGEQIHLTVTGIFSFVAIDCREQLCQLEEIQNPHGKVLPFLGADVERESLPAKFSQQLVHACEN